MYHQRYTAKRFLRSYHGDHLPEKRFKRWFLPVDLPPFVTNEASGADSKRSGGLFETIQGPNTASKSHGGNLAQEVPKLPVSSLMVREVERRLDTVVFRSCFARSIYEARAMVLAGSVSLNGTRHTDPGTLLNPGDLFTANPSSIPMLSQELAKTSAARLAQNPVTASTGTRVTMKETEEQAGAAKNEEDDEDVEASTEEETEGQAGEESTEGEAATTKENKAGDAESEKRKGGNNKYADVRDRKRQEASQPRELAKGEHRFTLPLFAAPFLFVPPYLEVSFTTCAAIYLRHPTLSTHSYEGIDKATNEAMRRNFVTTDIASPYDIRGELFNLAWEHYARNSPRVRGDMRRLRQEARVGTNGFESARAKDEWKRKVAERRGWLKNASIYSQIAYVNRRGNRMAKERKVFGHRVGHNHLGGKTMKIPRSLKRLVENADKKEQVFEKVSLRELPVKSPVKGRRGIKGAV